LSLAWKMDKNTTFLYYLTAGLGALVPLSASLILKLLIDHLQLIQNSFIPNIPLTVAFVLAARYLVTLLDGVIYWGANQGYLDYIFRYELQNEVTMKFHQKISKLDIAYFENPETQDLITKTRDTMQWRVPEYLRVLSLLFRDSVAFLAAFIVLLPYGWWIPLLVSAIALPRLYLQTRYGNVQWSIWGSGAPQARKLWYLNYLLQEPMTVRETRISQSSSSLLSKFKEIQTYLFQLNKKALDDYLRVSTIPPILETILIFLVAYQFLPQVTFGFLTVGSFTLIINMLEQLGNRAAGASARIGQLYENNLYLNHYFEFLGLPSIVKQTRKAVIFKKIEPPEIEFRNVSFAYRLGPKVLNNISIKIRSGENIALVGHNGAGKTTFVKLLCRFYDVTEGEILINGQNLKSLDLPNWYQHLGTLFQEFVKYHFSVRENITLGAPNKRDEKAMISTAGTNIAAILSANSWTGALDPCASSINLIICANVVSLPTFVALNLKDPLLFIVPPITASFIFFSTGILSPVTMDSSTLEYPSITFPSTGILCPGLTTIISPTTNCSTGISRSRPSLITIADLGLNPISFLMA